MESQEVRSEEYRKIHADIYKDINREASQRPYNTSWGMGASDGADFAIAHILRHYNLTPKQDKKQMESQEVISKEYGKILKRHQAEINEVLVNLVADVLAKYGNDLDKVYRLVPKMRNIDAIRAEAERRYPDDEVMATGELSDILTEGFVEGAMWALGYESDDEQPNAQF